MSSRPRNGPCYPALAARADYRLLQTFRALAASTATGIVEVRSGDEFAWMYVLGGRLVFAETGSFGLAHNALGSPAIGAADYANVVRTMTERFVDNEQMRFSEAVIALGLMSAHEVYQALAAQVRLWAMACLSWDNAEHSFSPAEEALSEIAHFPQQLEALIVDSVERHYDRERIQDLLAPVIDLRVRLSGAVAEAGAALGLASAELRWLNHIDGQRSLRELLRNGPISELAAGRLLGALLLMDYLEAPATTGARAAPPLSVAQAGDPQSTAALRAQLDAARRIMDARRHADPALREAICSKLGQLSRSLGAPMRMSKLDGLSRAVVPASERAQQHFLAGKHFLAEHQYLRAAQEFALAVELVGPTPVYNLYACWAEYRSARSEGERARRQAELSVLWKAAATHDRKLAFAHYVAGQLAMIGDDLAAARRAFRLARELDPGDVEIERHLRLLQRRLTTLPDE